MLARWKRKTELLLKHRKDTSKPACVTARPPEPAGDDYIPESPCLEGTTSITSSHTKNNSAPSELNLEQLPDVVLGKIISFLHWKEKEWLQQAFPSLSRIMESPLAWDHFENDRNYAVEKLYMLICSPFLIESELAVIHKYGQYFQSCTLWFHRVAVMNKEADNDFRLLRAVSEHCQQLKKLSLIHTSEISVAIVKSCAQSYTWSLQHLSSQGGGGFRISLNRLFYASTESSQSGIFSYLTYIEEKGLLKYISCLDFSHGLLQDFCHHYRISHLNRCENLRTLKCPVQALTSAVVVNLGNRYLQDLYLVNDDHTQQINFCEKLMLDWPRIHSELQPDKGSRLNVHYIFKNRTVSSSDCVPNPHIRSLIFDNLSSNIPSVLLRHIADLYGQTITTLAFCSNYWEFLMHFADLGTINENFKYLATKCVKLESFLSCLSLPSSALVNLVYSSTSISTLRVYKENIRLTSMDAPEEFFNRQIAESLGISSWGMVKKGDNIFTLPNVDCRMLFASCFREF